MFICATAPMENPEWKSKKTPRAEPAPKSEFSPIFQQLEALADFYAGCDPLELNPQSLEDHQRRLSEAKSTLWQMRKQRTDVARMIADPFSPKDIERKIQIAEKHLGQVRQYVEDEKKAGKYFDAVHQLSNTLEDLVIEFRQRKR